MADRWQRRLYAEEFGASSILVADTASAPFALTVGASTIIGRKAAGGIVALSVSEARDLLSVPFVTTSGVVGLTTATDRVAIPAGSAATVPLTVSGYSGQSANLLDVRNSASSLLMRVGPSGDILPGSDNARDLGDAATGFRKGFFRTGLEVRGAANDTNPMASLTSSALMWGPGGSSAVDVGLERTAAATVTLTADSRLRLAQGSAIQLSEGPSNGKFTGIVTPGTGDVALVFGDLVYMGSDGKWHKTNADDAATSGDVMIGMCVLACSAGAATQIILCGIVRSDDFPAMTASAPMYVGLSAGEIQDDQPTGTDEVVRRVGHAIGSSTLYFNPSLEYIVLE